MDNLQPKQEDQILDGKVIAILSYLSIFCIIPLIFKKDNAFVFEHGKQGLVLFVGQVAVFIAHIVLGSWILRVGIFIFGLLSFVGMIAVLQGKSIKLPLISTIADSIYL